MSEIATLVCARADEPMMCEGTVFGHHCSQCGTEVMVAPSGQDMLKLHPEMLILCRVCFMATNTAVWDTQLAGPKEQIMREASTAKPNPRRRCD